MSKSKISKVKACDDCEQAYSCPLSQVVAGTAVRIKQIEACEEMSQRLREMGICEEQEIKLLLKDTNLICQVCHMRLGISSKLADTIIVEPLVEKTFKAA